MHVVQEALCVFGVGLHEFFDPPLLFLDGIFQLLVFQVVLMESHPFMKAHVSEALFRGCATSCQDLFRTSCLMVSGRLQSGFHFSNLAGTLFVELHLYDVVLPKHEDLLDQTRCHTSMLLLDHAPDAVELACFRVDESSLSCFD